MVLGDLHNLGPATPGGGDQWVTIIPSGHEFPLSTYPSARDLADGIAVKFGLGAFVSSGNAYVGDRHSIFYPAPWLEGWEDVVGDGAATTLVFSPDAATILYVKSTLIDNTAGRITSSFATNNWATTPLMSGGGLLLRSQDGSSDIAGTIYRYTYELGVVYISTANNRIYAAHMFSKNGNVIGIISYVKDSRVFASVAESRAFNITLFDGEALPNGYLYFIKEKFSTVSGTIFDPAGEPSPNCHVLVLRRDTLKEVARTVSDERGEYSTPVPSVKGDVLTIIGLDNDEDPLFDGVVYDRVVVG